MDFANNTHGERLDLRHLWQWIVRCCSVRKRNRKPSDDKPRRHHMDNENISCGLSMDFCFVRERDVRRSQRRFRRLSHDKHQRHHMDGTLGCSKRSMAFCHLWKWTFRCSCQFGQPAPGHDKPQRHHMDGTLGCSQQLLV